MLELRSTNVPLQINEYGKIVLCTDIACSLLDIGFDKEQALKLSALRKTHYANNKRMFEKLLELNRLASIKDICVQLSLNEVAHKAEDILALFKKVAREDVDPEHPQYAAMAVFHACRLMKKKVSKPKLMPFSNLRPTQWQQLDQQWDRMIAKHLNDTNIAAGLNNKLVLQEEQNILTTKKKSSEKVEIEEYEKWKSRMLKLAEAKLKEQESNV